MGREFESSRERLQREAAAGNYVMFRGDENDPNTPWLGRFDPALQRWILVTPKAGSIALTIDQLLLFGFTDYMLVRLSGLEKAF